MQIMAQYSPMHDEAALLGMLRSLQGGSSGTAIWCYNMRTPTEFSTEVRRVFKVYFFSGEGGSSVAFTQLSPSSQRVGRFEARFTDVVMESLCVVPPFLVIDTDTVHCGSSSPTLGEER